MKEELEKKIIEDICIDAISTNLDGIDEEIYDAEAQSSEFRLPTKISVWTKFKNFLFKEIKVELTPYQQKVEDEINEFLHQEITWKKVHGFLFQEISFGKKEAKS